MTTDRAAVLAAYAALEDAVAAVNSLDYAGLPINVLLALQSRRETLRCAGEAVDHQILAAAQTQATAKEIGAKDWPEVLHVRLRISREEARRRVRDCDHLGPRSAITGEALGPVWELVAAALAEGAINGEHVAVITNFFTKVPLWAADPVTMAQCEADLVADARVKTPEDRACQMVCVSPVNGRIAGRDDRQGRGCGASWRRLHGRDGRGASRFGCSR